MNEKRLVIADPRSYDGDPYQVAERAVQQLRGIVLTFQEVLDPTRLMARNAELERLLATKTEQDELREKAHAWDEGPQGRQFQELSDQIAGIDKKLAVLERAVAYNPNAR